MINLLDVIPRPRPIPGSWCTGRPLRGRTAEGGTQDGGRGAVSGQVNY